MTKKINLKVLKSEIRLRVKEFYPYFLGFYFLSLVISYFSKIWSGFFYWPAFHGSAIFFSLLFILTFEFNFKFRDIKDHFEAVKNFRLKFGLQIFSLVKALWRHSQSQSAYYFKLIYFKLSGLSSDTWRKISLIAVILFSSLFLGISPLGFLTLSYALISFIFILDSRWSASIAIMFLVLCPILLFFKQDILAEIMAIYAYYFLLITVLTQIRELREGL